MSQKPDIEAKPPLHVLILEDSPADARFAARTLEAAGFELDVDLATGRERFEALLAGEPYDLILADFSLPDFDGHAALELAKPACPTTPFVCVSGVIGEEATAELLKQGADDVVLKDHLARLPFAVRRALDERARTQALRDIEERYGLLFAGMPDGVAYCRMLHDEDGRPDDFVYLSVNPAFERITGLTDVVGKRFNQLFPTAQVDTPEVVETYGRVAHTGTPEEYDIDFTPLGLSLHVSAFQPEPDHFVGVLADVSERKQAEEALRESEARYRGYVDNAPYGVFVSDEQGRYLEVNKAAAELTGYAPEELEQLSIADAMAPESHEWWQQHFARLLRSGHSSGEGVFRRKDGTSFPARVDAVRLAATRYLGFIVDTSEQQRAAAELEASAAQVKQALTATVAALSATTELRDPYTAGHQRRVAELAGAIAAGLGWDEARIEMVTTAGLLHDVGKIIVPAEILAKPGRLSELEMQIIRGHAAASAALIAGIEFGGPVAAMVNQHHERLDGSGYPQGLRGENILPEARVLAVADVVEAMASHRPYRPALGMEAALAEVREHAGEKYDADVVTACGRLVEEQGLQFTP